MNAHAVAWVWIYSKTRGIVRLVLVAIAARVYRGGVQTPPTSTEDLAKQTGLSERTVRRAVEELERKHSDEIVVIEGTRRGQVRRFRLRRALQLPLDIEGPSNPVARHLRAGRESGESVPSAVRESGESGRPAVRESAEAASAVNVSGDVSKSLSTNANTRDLTATAASSHDRRESSSSRTILPDSASGDDWIDATRLTRQELEVAVFGRPLTPDEAQGWRDADAREEFARLGRDEITIQEGSHLWHEDRPQ